MPVKNRCLSLDSALDAALRAAAEERHQPVSWVATELLARALDVQVAEPWRRGILREAS
ncbi:MAG TPA: hypothetical protein VLW50_04520 [Streptosporangiaceae bacterium]|nr:hypothetical protein [Streptosporangiaceae bacterium]